MLESMKDRHPVLARAYGTFWALLLAAFVTIGGRYVWIGPSEAGLIRNTPFASSDAYFLSFFHAAEGSKLSLEIVRRFYGKGTIVLFSPPRSSLGELGFYLVSYLSWPERVRKVEVEPSRLDEAVRSLDRVTTSGVIFSNLRPPPNFTRGWRIGPWIFAAPLEQVK
jgi:hypothetical protein